MNNYEAPVSNVDLPVLEFKPIRGVIYALLIAIVGVSIFSLVGSIVAIALSGVSFMDEAAVDAALSQNTLFMVVDAIGSVFLFILAGRVLAIHVPGREMLFSIMVTGIVLAVYGVTFFYAEGAFSAFPVWYNVASIACVIFGISIGAGLVQKFSAKNNIKSSV